MKSISLAFTLTTFAAAQLSAQSIVGSWYATQAGEAKTDVVIAFLANGIYLLAEDGDSKQDPSGKDGVERGTYQWDATTNVFTNNTLVDTNGEWGLSSEEALKVSVSGNTLTLDGVKFKKVTSKTNKLVGTWYLKEGGGYAAVTFLADGTYLMGQDGKPGSGGRTGVERGTYQWNARTKAFKPKVLMDTNGTWGFSDMAKGTILVSKNTITIKAPGDGSFTLARVVAP